MDLIAELVHPSLSPDIAARAPRQHRRAARGIVFDTRRILLLYTERYDDFSLPGGGIDAGETLQEGLRREMAEEVGAHALHVLAGFGRVDEFRPQRGDAEGVIFMQSYLYRCALGAPLQAPKMEHYERANGMRVEWVDIDHAIAHNAEVVRHAGPKMGLSVQRELLCLQRIRAES